MTNRIASAGIAPKPVPVRATPLVHWPIVALATVPCVFFVGLIIALLAWLPAPRPTSTPRSSTVLAAATPAPATPAVVEVPDVNAEIKIPAHHAMAAIQDLPVFDVPAAPEQPGPAAQPRNDLVQKDIVPMPPEKEEKPIVPVKPEKEEKEDGCFGTAVNFLPSPTEAFTAAKKEKRLTFILHVSGNFEDSGFT
jgi:hypothetical protein